MPRKLSFTKWIRRLATLDVMDEEVTLEEFQARCLMDIRDNLIKLNQGTEHIEAMAVARDSVDMALARSLGLAPMTPEERVEAIDRHHEARRAIRGQDTPPVVDLSSLPARTDGRE